LADFGGPETRQLPRIDKKSISTSTVLGLRLQLVF
jgi:hypothetical protein